MYNDFFELDLQGCGPAFFTKIMFFFSSNLRCFIMDQWTSRSINLLLGENLIKLDNKITVNKKKNIKTAGAILVMCTKNSVTQLKYYVTKLIRHLEQLPQKKQSN